MLRSHFTSLHISCPLLGLVESSPKACCGSCGVRRGGMLPPVPSPWVAMSPRCPARWPRQCRAAGSDATGWPQAGRGLHLPWKQFNIKPETSTVISLLLDFTVLPKTIFSMVTPKYSDFIGQANLTCLKIIRKKIILATHFVHIPTPAQRSPGEVMRH